ncbi:MAG: hypothetical protein F6K31_02380 [Symploca sp. SIO2G7]|nr:hypothetical protein [Symploca sp. SIO2G7]
MIGDRDIKIEDENEIGASLKEQVRSVLSKVWEVQYEEVLGDDDSDSLDKLYDAVQGGKSLDDLLSSPKGGSAFDFTATWELLYQAVGLTFNVIVLYKIFKQEHKRSPSKKELLQKVTEAGIPSDYERAVLKKLDILIEETIKNPRIIHTDGGNYNEKIVGNNITYNVSRTHEVQ